MELNKKTQPNNLLIKKAAKETVIRVFKYAFLISVGYIVLFQLFYMLSYAFRPVEDMLEPSVVWLPRELTVEHFKNAFAKMKYMTSLWNTLSIHIVSAFIEVGVCAVVAYGFARFNFPFKNLLFALVLATIVVPTKMIAVPLYLNYAFFDIFGILGGLSKLVGTELRPNLLDSGLVFYLPSIFANGIRSGLFIFIYRQFFRGLPLELEEAANIDGAGPIKTFLHIIVPSSGVAILTVTIFSVVWHWNEYDLSLLFFNDKFPLSVELSFINSSLASGVTTNRGYTMAGCLLFVLPVLIMYIILQRKFIQSIDRVGIVG